MQQYITELRRMQQLAGIITEEESQDLTPQEQVIVDDILGGLDEGAFDSVLEKTKKYAKKGLLTASIMAALLAAPNLSKAEKSQLQALTHDTTTTATDSTKGTFVDGKIGKWTSQFMMPKISLDKGKTWEYLPDTVNRPQITALQMDDWNTFVKWMKSKGYSGDSSMNHIKKSTEVLHEYRKENPNFFIRDSNDIKRVQTYMKLYRRETLKLWKAGKMAIQNAAGKEWVYSYISPAERLKAESEYMPYAK